MKLEFRKWFTSMQPTRLAIFDFDGTIANVPERPGNWGGKDWWGHPDSLSQPYFDGCVNNEVIEAFKAAKADPQTKAIMLTGRRGVIASSVRKVLRDNDLIGRRIIPKSNKDILQKYEDVLKRGHDIRHSDEEHAHAHEEYYSGDHTTEPDYPKGPKGKPDGSTGAFKLYVARKLMNSQIKEVDLWDDRDDHIRQVWIPFGMEIQKQYPGVKVTLHRVHPQEYPGGQCYVSHLPIKPGMSY